MRIIDIVILLIIGYVVYLLTKDKQVNKAIITNKKTEKKPYIDDEYLDNLVDEINYAA